VQWRQHKLDYPPRVIICVGAVVLRRQKVLLVRQTYGALKGVWSIPWGYPHGDDPRGFADSPHVAALRETLEEGGVEAEIEGLLGVQTHERVDSGEPAVYLLFLCRHAGGEPRPDDQETDRAAYFSLADLDALDEPVDEFCEWLARRVLKCEHRLIAPEARNPYRPHQAFL
jgi:ADP-ribose pyrophosphatase YjhB (NUDIX family)